MLDDITAMGADGLDPSEPPPRGVVESGYVRERYGIRMPLRKRTLAAGHAKQGPSARSSVGAGNRLGMQGKEAVPPCPREGLPGGWRTL
jgi:hypothetical protein